MNIFLVDDRHMTVAGYCSALSTGVFGICKNSIAKSVNCEEVDRTIFEAISLKLFLFSHY